jgi:hypothetical protein
MDSGMGILDNNLIPEEQSEDPNGQSLESVQFTAVGCVKKHISALFARRIMVHLNPES